jgi:hypothetical protein
LVPCLLAAMPSRAVDFELLSAGVRARVGEKRVLGTVQPESFRQYDAVATIRLPWEQPLPAGWEAGTRLLASAGVLEGAGQTALVVSLIPVLALGPQGGRFTLDLGIGLALLGRHRYAQQDFGGPLQFALTAGVSVPLLERVGVGYRFLHYSDARAYGRGTIGADFHMVELVCRF